MRKQTPNPTTTDIYDLLLLTYEKVKTIEQRVDTLEMDLRLYKEENDNFRSETRMNFINMNYRLDQIEDKISVLPQMQGDINMLKDQYVGLNSFINGELVVIQHTLGKHDKILSKIKS